MDHKILRVLAIISMPNFGRLSVSITGWRSQQNEVKPESGSRAPTNGPILLTYTLKEIFKGHKRSNLGQIVVLGSNRSNQSKCIHYTYVKRYFSIKNFPKNSDLIFFKLIIITVKRGQTWVKPTPQASTRAEDILTKYNDIYA